MSDSFKGRWCVGLSRLKVLVFGFAILLGCESWCFVTLGFRVVRLAFQSLGFHVSGLGFSLQVLRFRVFRLSGLGYCCYKLGCRKLEKLENQLF